MGDKYISPVYNIKRVPVEKIQANAYNPNSVAPPEMKLLYQSIKEDGYTMPIELMTNIVAELVESGMSDSWIAKNLGMDFDEILRLKQISGLASLFADKEFSNSWTPRGNQE